MLFDLNDVDRVGTLASLLFEELVQFHYIHCFYQLVSASQFIDIQINECVQIAVLRESFHTERIERAGGISSGRPPLGFGIEPHLCGFERCGHRSRFVLFQAEERSLVRFLGVVADIGERTGFDLTVDIFIVLETRLARDVLVLESHAAALRHRNQPEVQPQRERSDDERPQEIGPHQPPETHAARKHSHDLGLIGHFRGEENDGDEGEQSAELVDEERDEIQVIVENDRLERRFRFRKVVDLLHVVEDHHDHDDHRDSEEVGAQELAEDIPVEDLESGEAEMRELSFHRGSSVTACGRVWRPSAPSRV